MKKFVFVSTLVAAAILLPVTSADAHPGRTDKNGGHTCYTNCASWGLKTGQYHYHNGGTTSSGSTSSGSSLNLQVDENHEHYNVFQNDKLLTVLHTKEDAINYAKMWNHAIVQDANTYEILWDNIQSQVYQYGKYVSNFGSRLGAIGYAKDREYSFVRDAETNALLWHNYPYHVYQGDHYLDWFRKKDDAINYAKQWANSKVIDGLTYEVVWKF